MLTLTTSTGFEAIAPRRPAIKLDLQWNSNSRLNDIVKSNSRLVTNLKACYFLSTITNSNNYFSDTTFRFFACFNIFSDILHRNFQPDSTCIYKILQRSATDKKCVCVLSAKSQRWIRFFLMTSYAGSSTPTTIAARPAVGLTPWNTTS